MSTFTFLLIVRLLFCLIVLNAGLLLIMEHFYLAVLVLFSMGLKDCSRSLSPQTKTVWTLPPSGPIGGNCIKHFVLHFYVMCYINKVWFIDWCSFHKFHISVLMQYNLFWFWFLNTFSIIKFPNVNQQRTAWVRRVFFFLCFLRVTWLRSTKLSSESEQSVKKQRGWHATKEERQSWNDKPRGRASALSTMENSRDWIYVVAKA